MKQELLEEKIYALADSDFAKTLQLSVKHDCMGWRLYRDEKVIARGGAQNVYECLSMLMEIYTFGYSNGVKDKGVG